MGDQEGVIYFNELLYEVTKISMEDCISASKSQEVLNFIVNKNHATKKAMKLTKAKVF